MLYQFKREPLTQAGEEGPEGTQEEEVKERGRMKASLEPFESWLLRRVAHAVEARDVPASLLSELQAEIEAARDLHQEESRAEAVRNMAEQLGIPLAEVERALVALEAQPTVTRELLMRRIGRRGWRGSGGRMPCLSHSEMTK